MGRDPDQVGPAWPALPSRDADQGRLPRSHGALDALRANSNGPRQSQGQVRLGRGSSRKGTGDIQGRNQAGKELASEEYMAELWDLDFRRRLGEVVKAYSPREGETVQSILESYRADGLEFVEKKFR